DAVSAALGGLPGGGEVELSVLRAGAEAAARLGLRALGADDRGAAAAAEAFVGAVVRARASAVAQTFWLLVLFAYVFVASVVPVWILLQPRDYLNSYLLYAMILLGFAGILATAPRLQMSAWAGWSATDPSGQPGMLFPLLFVTVACGACSGFHALVASGTSAKQVDREAHILPVAYGGMLVEGLLAVMALISVGYLTGDEYRAIIVGKGSVAAFAGGLATFATRLGIPIQAGTTFVALAISAFMLTTLDTATRLTRFAWQELFLPRGMGASVGLGPLRRHLGNPWVATAVAVAVAGYLALSGEGMTIWPVFGASNQLLAALTLLAVSLYLIRRRLPYLVALLPMVLMVAISGWALVVLFGSNWGKRPALVLATLFLLAMAVLLIVLAVLSLRQARPAEQSVPGPG
ncbi:MAG: carbon starvation protein A, partial [Lentisphaeria bacterium]|nr:carbon starvation protein A [Lentisphaeria bacterium]